MNNLFYILKKKYKTYNLNENEFFFPSSKIKNILKKNGNSN